MIVCPSSSAASANGHDREAFQHRVEAGVECHVAGDPAPQLHARQHDQRNPADGEKQPDDQMGNGKQRVQRF